MDWKPTWEILKTFDAPKALEVFRMIENYSKLSGLGFVESMILIVGLINFKKVE